MRAMANAAVEVVQLTAASKKACFQISRQAVSMPPWRVERKSRGFPDGDLGLYGYVSGSNY